ncbi:BglG family transcription antiterminator [Lactiplantibacillus plantarum]|uniref:BglG family transcription antiterminator n=1 Tax=Lactiplantibacillus plantarum TaxID=1590 RepID=UPI003C1EE391
MEVNDIKHGEDILELLLQPSSYVDFNRIHEVLHISRRTFFYALKKINHYLDDNDLDTIQNVKGVGYHLSDDTKHTLLKEFSDSKTISQVFSQRDRKLLTMLSLINHEYVSLENNQRRFHITHHTAVSDLKALKVTALNYGLTIISGTNGTSLTGTERNQRNWFLTVLGENGPLINSALKIDPNTSLEITHFLRTLETDTGNYFSDDTLTILITFFSWYLNRLLTNHSFELKQNDANMSEQVGIINNWAKAFLCHYQIYNVNEQLFITYLVKSGQFIHINPDNKLAHKLAPIVRQIIRRFNDVSGSQISVESLEVPLLTHLLSTYYRVKYQITFKQPSLSIIMKQYNELIFFTRLSLKPFEDLIDQRLSDEEVTLVAIYFGGILRKENKPDYAVDVVCSSGIGTSKVLHEELRQRYPNVKFSEPMSVFKLKNSHSRNIKLIISTIKLTDSYPVPTIVVAPIPTKIQWQQINQALISLKIIKRSSHNALTVTNLMDIIGDYARISNPVALESTLSNLLAKNQPTPETALTNSIGLQELLSLDNILISQRDDLSWKDAIINAFTPLFKKGYINRHYIDTIIASTVEHGPYMVIGNGVMLAHARPADGVRKVGMSLLVLKKPIKIYDENTKHAKRINVIIGLAPIDAAEHVLALSQLVKLFQQPHWLANIENATNAQMVYDSCFPN